MNFEVGEILKSTDSNFVFKCVGFTKGHRLVPDNWPLCKDKLYHNPKFLKKYNGAISALNLAE
jgi:hypothetical protein